MNISLLTELMPPPVQPFESPAQSTHWLKIDAELSIQLPQDYKRFIELYGSGVIDKFLTIFNPFASNQNLNLMSQLVTQRQVYFELESYGEDIPYKFFPVNGGIFPLGMTDNGDVLFWKTSGYSENWSIIINESRAPEWECFDMSLTSFLINIFNRTTVCNSFPASFPSHYIKFRSII